MAWFESEPENNYLCECHQFCLLLDISDEDFLRVFNVLTASTEYIRFIELRKKVSLTQYLPTHLLTFLLTHCQLESKKC